MKSFVSCPLSVLVQSMYVFIWLKTHKVSSEGKALRITVGGVYPGRLCFTCSGKRNSNIDSSCFIKFMSSIWGLCPRWAVTKATSITSFIERVLRFMVLGVPKEDKYLKTGSTSQVVSYLGFGGLLLNMLFINLETTGWFPTVVLSFGKVMADTALLAVFIVVYSRFCS